MEVWVGATRSYVDAGLAVCNPEAMMLVDAFRTRDVLEQNPKIGKIGISGWSLGDALEHLDAHLPFNPAAISVRIF